MASSEALDEPLKKLLGPKTAKVLELGLGLATVGDLLRHYPRRYAERGELTTLSDLAVGEQVTVMAQVTSVSSRTMRERKGNILEVVVSDGQGSLSLTFFNQRWRDKDLRIGRRGLFAGKVSDYRGKRQLANPDYQLLSESDGPLQVVGDTEGDAVEEFAGSLIPVYGATAAMPTWRVGQCVRMALDTVGALDDPIPEIVRHRRQLVDLESALRLVHQPSDRIDITRAHQRLKYEEAFVLQAVLAQRRCEARGITATPRPIISSGLLAAFDARLPFTLTAGQLEVADTVAADLEMPHPMHRLLQGEVGSGKTVVALRAMLTVVDNGGQAALLAPTEVLAQQHHRSVVGLLGPLAERGLLGGSDQGTKVTLLTGSLSTAARRQALLDIASGEAGVVIGTHALLEESVLWQDLGLVVVDEQHRFGVEQRAALLHRGDRPPHVLVMTATPIPRTVAMTVFGDLETSVLRGLPQGRSPISTHVVPADKPAFLERAWQRVREEVAQGHQVFVVCPRIGDAEGSDDPGLGVDLSDIDAGDEQRRPPSAVLDVFEQLRSQELAGLRMAMLHGRLSPDVKDDTMRRFSAGEIDVLVATTVIEVGVDVPNASVMVVMDAERFGVSQLHQLRGRVGRGSVPGLCLLVTDLETGHPGRDRLDGVAETLDGFALARMDLEQRREGDVLGAAQSGRRSSLRLLSVLRDEDVIVLAREDASQLVAGDPFLDAYPLLVAEIKGWEDQGSAGYLDKG